MRNLHLSPVVVDIVAEYLKQIAEKKVYGITHLSGLEDVSYVDVAHYLAKLIDADQNLILPTSTESLGKLPVYASLDMTESAHVFDAAPDLSFNATMQHLYG